MSVRQWLGLLVKGSTEALCFLQKQAWTFMFDFKGSVSTFLVHPFTVQPQAPIKQLLCELLCLIGKLGTAEMNPEVTLVEAHIG